MSDNSKSQVNTAPSTPYWIKYPEIALNTALRNAASTEVFRSIPARNSEWIDGSTILRAGRLREYAKTAAPMLSGINAATDVLDLINTYREDLRGDDRLLTKTCSKIVGTTASSVFVGSSVYAAAGILAGGVTAASLGAAVAVAAAGGAAAYFSIKYAQPMLSTLDNWIRGR